MQIAFVIHTIGKKMNVQVHASCGGIEIREDAKMLKTGVHVVVGTPGRICDMMKRKCL